MAKFPFIKQLDSMQCGIACLQMVCKFFGKDFTVDYLSSFCCITSEGVSLLGIRDAAKQLGFHTMCGRASVDQITACPKPCIIHWNQNHFVVLYRVEKAKRFYIADPGKGLIDYNREEFEESWVSTLSEGGGCGIVLCMEPRHKFYEHHDDKNIIKRRSFSFLYGYIRQYRQYFTQIILGLIVGCVLQLIMPFLTQTIVDVGISSRNIGFIWLILIGELVIVVARTTTDFIRRWLLLHISMRINISLVSDFLIKLLRLPMAFFDTKQMGICCNVWAIIIVYKHFLRLKH